MDAVIIFNFPATVNSRVELGIEHVARAAQGPALPPKQGSSVFATPKANFISTFAHPGAGLHSCSAGGAGGEREPPGPPPQSPCSGVHDLPQEEQALGGHLPKQQQEGPVEMGVRGPRSVQGRGLGEEAGDGPCLGSLLIHVHRDLV